MKNEKTQTMPQSWSTEWQSDLMMTMMMAMTMIMIVNCIGQHIFMEFKLRQCLGDDIVITELHCERNVNTFCLTVVSFIFLWYCFLIVNQPNGCFIHSSIIVILYFKTIPRDNCWGEHGGTNIIYWPSVNAVHESKGFAPFTVYWPCISNTPSLWFKIFNRLPTGAPILQLLQGGAEI